MIVKSLTSVEIETTELMKRHQHITKLQSELIKEKKVEWPQTRWGYSKTMLSWKKQNISYCLKLSCHNCM